MAERRAEDPAGTPGKTSPDELTQRINAAYASSAPAVPDEPAGGAHPTDAERFAAVLAAAGASAARTGTVPGAAKPAPAKPVRRVRKAHLRLTHVDPWSVMKTAFLLSVALGIVVVVAVGVVWAVLDVAGVWTSIDSTVADGVGETSSTFRVEDYVGMSRVLGFTLIVAVVDIVLITVMATLGAFLYNLAATLLGGIEVVLAEDDR